MLKIYSDKKYLKSKACLMMLPFWDWPKNENDPDSLRFDDYLEKGKEIFQLTSLEECDFAIFPEDPFGPSFLEFQKLTEPKKLIVFYNHDSDKELFYRNNTYVFRTSFYKSTQKPNEFAVPGWSVDKGSMELRKWKEKPIISFCGQQKPFYARKDVLNILDNSEKIKTNFIIRNTFWAGLYDFKNKNELLRVREEFMNNIFDSDYSFCARGGGNFSYRIYEIMSCGRIPILLNTDCVLPYDFLIEWKNIFPIIDIKDKHNMPDIIINFHNSIKNEFEERQKLIRQLYEECISPIGFFKNIHKHFVM